jgi:hypothetical protein
MAPSGAGPGTRAGTTRAKLRPFPLTAVRRAPGRGAVALTAARTKGVGRPTNAAPPAPANQTVLDDAIATAFDCIELLERHTQEVADAFRWEHIDEARQGLTELVQSTQMLLRLAAVTAQASGVHLAEIPGRHGARVDESTHAAVELIIEQQLAGDWAALAETLDDDFTAALMAWRQVFEALARVPPDGDPPGRAA